MVDDEFDDDDEKMYSSLFGLASPLSVNRYSSFWSSFFRLDAHFILLR